MAKSLRSKWKRKMKAEKRVRYGEKERVRLLNMLEEAKVAEQEPIVRLRRVFKTTEKKEEETATMEVEKEPRNIQNKNGTFPVWMAKRKIKKITGNAKKTENKKKERAAKKSHF
jgi:hypothetical protein